MAVLLAFHLQCFKKSSLSIIVSQILEFPIVDQFQYLSIHNIKCIICEGLPLFVFLFFQFCKQILFLHQFSQLLPHAHHCKGVEVAVCNQRFACTGNISCILILKGMFSLYYCFLIQLSHALLSSSGIRIAANSSCRCATDSTSP